MTELFESGEPWFAAAGTLLIGVAVALAAGMLVRFLAHRLLEDEDRAGHAAMTAFWGVVIVFGFVAIVRLFGGEVAQAGLAAAGNRLFSALPDVVLALLVLTVGFVVAAAIRAAVSRLAEYLGPNAAEVAAPIAYWTVVALAVLLAANQVGVQTRLAEFVVGLVLSGVVLAGALAVGLGSRELVAAMMAGRHVARILALGDEVEADGRRGRVTRLGAASVRLDVGEEEVEVPNDRFLSSAVVIRRDDEHPTAIVPSEEDGSRA